MIYIVFYEIIGSRCNGTYLVNAKTKAKAKQIVRAIDKDYVCRDTPEAVGKIESLIAMTQDRLDNDQMMEWCLNVEDIRKVRYDGSYHQLECGT